MHIHTHTIHLFWSLWGPQHTRDITMPSQYWRPLFPSPLSLSSQVSSWPTSQVAASAMASFRRWCHGRFAPLKALYFFTRLSSCSPTQWPRLLSSLPLTSLFPTAKSLTPFSPTRSTPPPPLFHKLCTSMSNKDMWCYHLGNQLSTLVFSSLFCNQFGWWGHPMLFLILRPIRFYMFWKPCWLSNLCFKFLLTLFHHPSFFYSFQLFPFYYYSTQSYLLPADSPLAEHTLFALLLQIVSYYW